MPGTTKSAWVAKEVVMADRGLDYFLHNNIGVGLVSSLGILRFSWADLADQRKVSGICEVSSDFDSTHSKLSVLRSSRFSSQLSGPLAEGSCSCAGVRLSTE